MNPDPTSLDRLHDVIAPAPAPWWPPAPGWYWVLGLLFVIVLVLALRFIIRWQHNRYRREALAEWHRQDVRLRESGERASALTAMSVLLKRVAVTAFPRHEVAPLNGSAWLAFLDRTTGTTAYSSAEAAALERAAYDPRSAADIDDARAQKTSKLVYRWIADHRSDTRPSSSTLNSSNGDRGRGRGTKGEAQC
jgi:hypothetical protein